MRLRHLPHSHQEVVRIAVLICKNAAGVVIPEAGTAPYVWDHSTAQEWVQADGSGGWVPATSNGSEMVLTSPIPGAPYARPCQTLPLTYQGTPAEGILFAARIRGECSAMPTPLVVYVALEYSAPEDPAERRGVMGKFRFSESFDYTWVRSAVLVDTDHEPPVCKIWVRPEDFPAPSAYEFTIYVNDSEVQDADENRLVVGADPGYVPEAGSTWVEQVS